MRAVNLIPAESGRTGARSGVGPYLLLGVLGALLVGTVAYVLTGNAIGDRRTQLATLQTQVTAVQAQADATRPYRDFASLAQARVQTVRQLGEARFDWQRALGDLSKVIPDNVWLTSLLGTVTTGVSVQGAGSGTTSTLRSALPNPAIELTGCTTDHDSVVRLISRLRLIDSVKRVALADSVKGDGGGAGSGASGDCRYGHTGYPQFDLVIFFDPIPALPTATASTTTPGAVASAVIAQPAATTTPAPTGTGSTGSDAR